MKVSKNDCIDGIKLLDKDGEYIVNELMGEERENRYWKLYLIVNVTYFHKILHPSRNGSSKVENLRDFSICAICNIVGLRFGPIAFGGLNTSKNLKLKLKITQLHYNTRWKKN